MMSTQDIYSESFMTADTKASDTTEKSTGEALKERLFYDPKNTYTAMSQETLHAANDFARDYMAFLDAGKTEREVVKCAVEMAKKAGFQPYTFGMTVHPGDRLYYNNRGKSLHIWVMGQNPLDQGVRISAAHIDSPRIDLKPHPLYEDSSLCFLKTRYYGGIKKYQWTTIPLALHGTVIKKDSTPVDICIGEREQDPVFYITDLLPHLGRKQQEQPMSKAITGEHMNILFGSVPYPDDDKVSERVKLNLLQLLNKTYGIVEEDFITAELCLVPAFHAREVGLDRSMIGAYGHDDRVCAYPMLRGILEAQRPGDTVYAILADKEETGSDGVSGMQCDIMLDILEDMARSTNANIAAMKAHSTCLSADVNAAFDPNYADVYDTRNVPLLNKGVVITKYTGGAGKYSTSDATAEYFGKIRKLFDEHQVLWQTGELGKVEAGGGGTVAKYIANHNIDTIDAGVPVLSMHAPWEIVSKNDVYQTYLAVKAFNA